MKLYYFTYQKKKKKKKTLFYLSFKIFKILLWLKLNYQNFQEI